MTGVRTPAIFIYMSRTDTHSTDTRSALYPKGAGHMTTTFVQCPALVCTCGGSEVVTATYGPKTVRVAPCAPLRAQGWRGEVAVALSHSQALDLLVVA